MSYTTYVTTWGTNPLQQVQDMINKGVLQVGTRVVIAFAGRVHDLGGRAQVVPRAVARQGVDVRRGDLAVAVGRIVAPAGVVGEQQVKELPLTHQTDIFSLGVVLFQMLTGRLPFLANNNYSMIYQIINAEAPPPSTLRAAWAKRSSATWTESSRLSASTTICAPVRASQTHAAS